MQMSLADHGCPWLRFGFTTLPSSDVEQGRVAFCTTTGLFPAYAPATLAAATLSANRCAFGAISPQS